MDIAKLKRNLMLLDGKPPYNTPNNHCWNDVYFRRSIEKEFGEPIEELRKIVKRSLRHA